MNLSFLPKTVEMSLNYNICNEQGLLLCAREFLKLKGLYLRSQSNRVGNHTLPDQ